LKFYTTSNWGSNLDYEITAVDLLKERPAPLTLEDLEILEIDPPAWAVGAICKLGGRRHEKRHIVHTEFRSNYTPSHVNGYSPTHGPLASDTDVYNRALMRRNRKKAGLSNNEPSAKKQVPPGNLRNEDYRFWKGFPLPSMHGAVCKWCEQLCLDRVAMQKHHGGQRWCKERLLALYKYAKQSHSQHYCLACKKPTTSQNWGFPLCNSLTCIARWKFTNREGQLGLMQYLEWAMEAQRNYPEAGPFSHIPSDKPEDSGGH
jgi:hypothetical protein